MTEKTKSRSGKHKQGKVRMGIYVEPHRKVIAIIAARECNMTMTDIIWSGIESIAKGRGILNSDGKVTDQFLSEYMAAIEVVKQSEING